MPNRIPKRELNDFFTMKSPTPKTLNPTKWVVKAHLFLLVRLIEQLTNSKPFVDKETFVQVELRVNTYLINCEEWMDE